MTHALVCRFISKSFGDTPVIAGLDLSAHSGEIVALLGSSGCGKTTTLRLIAGLETLDSGEIEICGHVAARRDTHVPPERRRVGMVFQDYALFPHLSVAENIGFGIPGRSGRRDRIGEMLSLVELGGYEQRMPHELSGGQQQRVALARALAPGPALMLLDEPFSNLDPELRGTVREQTRRILRDAQATVVLVTHDQDEALSLSDRVAFMHSGRIVQVAAPEELYARPLTRTVAQFVGDAMFLPGDADGSVVRTELGELNLDRTAHGRVDVLIRPEMLAVTPREVPGDLGAQIVSRSFHGAFQSVTVRLTSGQVLVARIDSHIAVTTGADTDVRVVAPEVVAFPVTSTGA